MSVCDSRRWSQINQQFRQQRAAFLGAVAGIADAADREWYASVMLSRLMFIYFMQRKGFLDSDPAYLRNRLERTRATYGSDPCHSYYRDFLLRFFHEGLGDRARGRRLDKLLGRIPYLGGRLFAVHELERPERYGKVIQIPDSAFERLFDCFDGYEWHLDEKPLPAGNEITPDALGYVFEQYINKKQMGAYYTKDDITGYISGNTVLPFVFDEARATCQGSFDTPDGPTVWDLLRRDPERYIHKAVRHGITWHYRGGSPSEGESLQRPRELPEQMPVGNVPVPPPLGLPAETWHEVFGRRRWYQDVRSALAEGSVRDINDLITLNLDIGQFMQDVIACSEEPDLVRAIWRSVTTVTVLDPTCGSGAFLFAALNVLESLYDACLARMDRFVADVDRSGGHSDFRAILDGIAAHPNRCYFILKSIIVNNLYGVDIMEEAVEICKLRLFLKLAAHADPRSTDGNLGIDGLPDIAFNIHPGNSLVGYATRAEALENSARKDRSHRPFHWFAEFSGIMDKGGFDVIIGNPPYIAATKVRKLYPVKNLATAKCTDMYAWILERNVALLGSNGRSGMITPLSLTFSTDFDSCRRLLFSRYRENWFSSFGRIPSALFSFDVRIRNCIHLGARSTGAPRAHSSRLHRWFEVARPALFQTLQYSTFQPSLWKYRVPKMGAPLLMRAFEALLDGQSGTLDRATSPQATKHVLHFKKTAYNWLNFCRDVPPCYERGRRVAHTEFGKIFFPDGESLALALLLANGKLMLTFWFAVADDFHVTRWNFDGFPADLSSLSAQDRAALLDLVPALEERMAANVQFKLNAGRKVGNYNLGKCRDVTDVADRLLLASLGIRDAWDDVELYYAQTIKTDFSAPT